MLLQQVLLPNLQLLLQKPWLLQFLLLQLPFLPRRPLTRPRLLFAAEAVAVKYCWGGCCCCGSYWSCYSSCCHSYY